MAIVIELENRIEKIEQSLEKQSNRLEKIAHTLEEILTASQPKKSRKTVATKSKDKNSI